MAIEERFVAVISARDQASATLRAIGARFAALSQQTGMTRLAASVAGVGRALGGLATTALSVAGPMAAIGGAAVIGGLSSLAVRTAAAGDDLGDLSARTGIAVRDLQSLGEVASRTGVDQESLASSLQKLNRGMADAASGGNAELASVFRQLGISMRGSNGQIRSAAEVLPQLANAFERTENQALRTRLATELFGRSGEVLIPMLAGGSAALREGQERWARYGFSMEESAARMSEADGQFKDMGVAIRGLADAIGVQLAPILGPIAESVADWVAANRDLIATGIGDWARGVAASFSTFLEDGGPLERIQNFGATLGWLVDSVGGVQNLLIGFGALAAAPFVAALVSIGAAFVPLGVALAGFGVALMTTPIGWFLAGIAGVAAAVYLIYKNWEPIAAWFTGIWTNLVTGMAPQLDMLRQFIEAVGAPLVAGLTAAWEGVAGFFTGLWGRITSTFTTAWDTIRPIVEAVRRARALIPGMGSSPTGAVASPEAQAARRANQRGGGARPIEGFNDPLSAPLASPLAAAPAAAAPQGQVGVNVRFENAPPGTRVEAASSGALVAPPSTNVGYALGRAPR